MYNQESITDKEIRQKTFSYKAVFYSFIGIALFTIGLAIYTYFTF